MKCNQAGLDLIKSSEGFRSKPYRDIAGIWTIGYGTVHLVGGFLVNENTPSISEETAEEYLKYNLHKTEEFITRKVTITLNENQFSALCSLIYNIGQGNFLKSTLLKHLNVNDIDDARTDWMMWNHASGKVVAGLAKRRASELELFDKEI